MVEFTLLRLMLPSLLQVMTGFRHQLQTALPRMMRKSSIRWGMNSGTPLLCLSLQFLS